MKSLPDIRRELQALQESGKMRSLSAIRPEGLYLRSDSQRYLNLSSNDYLGLSASPFAQGNLQERWSRIYGEDNASSFPHGNPASRLMTANSLEYEILEQEIADLYPGRRALVLGCGFMLNSGLMPALCAADELILADKLSHASMIEGLRLSQAEFKRFRHNDVAHLEQLLQGAGKRPVTVMLESIYSMDGDLAPLQEIVELKRRYGFTLYVDEAHAFGVRGPKGAGYCAELGLDHEVDLLICTLGKAVAGAGAFVICQADVRTYLINSLRPLIFSTAIPPCTLQWNALVLHAMRTDEAPSGCPRMSALRQKLRANIEQFCHESGCSSPSQIIPLHAGSNERALAIAAQGREAGYWLTAIRHPTVPLGSARIRISLNAGLSSEDIHNFAQLCKKLG